ncbi:HAD family hydrolase [Tenacibaculum aestuariivivum]|uniref:HAD family hydrolase n=1 Tax=Tenacibaculum aestuariivivum TaxID=2006131 RepID=UPI003AB2B0A3
MKKKNLIVFDIDDTLTSSENKHQIALVNTMEAFGITKINQNWKSYKNVTDSYILKHNFEANFSQTFDSLLISAFEAKMAELFLELPKTVEISGAKNIIDFFMKETDYAICFATGSFLQPALLKLKQASINFVPALVAASNTVYTREAIVELAIAKAKKYFQVKAFENIISVGDGVWDFKTAKNLNLHFLGIRNNNLQYFQENKIKSHIVDWESFDFKKIKKELEII